jgi:hypothetical protein
MPQVVEDGLADVDVSAHVSKGSDVSAHATAKSDVPPYDGLFTIPPESVQEIL